MQRVYGFSWFCLQRAGPSVHGMLCVCHDRLPMLCLSLQPSSCAHGEPSQFTFCLCSCLKTSHYLLWSRVTMRSGRTAAVQQTAQCGRHPCFGCTWRTHLPDRFDSCSVNDRSASSTCVMSACEVWLFCARFMASSKTCEVAKGG
jgi:hypothetical protein